ncbi:SDR family NAD(P)-dependent oxidoreductase [Mycobacterium sp. OTB74]|uniref:SDR family NAD(P)-dependent oxidoreductase n=1 Tax=Mycobacterium sp. OTB74 TaxID=1853452 RepID=UPI002474C28E|nr:SDR family NAD(P)-dependent oxidoreductase [Mycobacterium sp. OTB74]MDH6244085.1 NAD(P)-dependent dehydrogenase (short-subunit alcohol dehydrogenase family) [Mycobacterium sp. OTB74]
MTYRDRVAVVTGAGSGIGRALTVALTRNGAHVAGWDVDPIGLAQTQAMCPRGHVTAYQVDVADRAAVFAAAEQVHDDLDAASMVFNNAGVDLMATVEDMSMTDFDWVTSINIGGVVNGTKAFLPQLIESGSTAKPSVLVNISSAFGLIAMPYQGAYSTAKFAVRGFTEALRQEMIINRRPINVHCVHPGVIRTNFGASMRIPEGVDPAETTKFFDKAALTNADKAARVILRGVDKNRPRIIIGPDGWAMAAMPRLLGVRYSDLLARATRMASDGALATRR